MIGLDTNVVVRYLMQDDPEQARVANEWIEQGLDAHRIFRLEPVTLCELVWVLETAYRCSRAEVVHALELILRTVQFEIAGKDQVWAAWENYRTGRGDFADYWIGETNRVAGCDYTLTFDQDLEKSKLFKVFKPGGHA